MQFREKSQLLSQGLWFDSIILAWGARDFGFDFRNAPSKMSFLVYLSKKNISAVIQSTKKWNFVSGEP